MKPAMPKGKKDPATPARVGRVWYNLIVGGGSPYVSTRKILPEVLATGYGCTLCSARKWAALAEKLRPSFETLRNAEHPGLVPQEPSRRVDLRTARRSFYASGKGRRVP